MTGRILRLASLGTCSALLLFAFGGAALASFRPVPEIDPGTAASGIAVLAGAALLLVERLRRR